MHRYGNPGTFDIDCGAIGHAAGRDSPGTWVQMGAGLYGNRHNLSRRGWFLSLPDRWLLFCGNFGRMLQEYILQAQSSVAGELDDNVNNRLSSGFADVLRDNPDSWVFLCGGGDNGYKKVQHADWVRRSSVGRPQRDRTGMCFFPVFASPAKRLVVYAGLYGNAGSLRLGSALAPHGKEHRALWCFFHWVDAGGDS